MLNPASTARSTKRKLDDALHSLDAAIGPLEALETASQVSPSKRARISRSIYSTLAKYGIKSKEPEPATKVNATEHTHKLTPHLAAIVARTASRTRKAMPFKFPGLNHGSTAQTTLSMKVSEYRPSSIQSFLSRLSTFKLSTYANKPAAIDAVAASKCGWTNDGKDRLVCGICANSWVVGGREGMSRDAANALLEKQRASLVDMHKDGCPWKMRQCDPTIYRIPLKPPASLAKDIKTRAVELQPMLEYIEIRHPLTSTQIQSLLSTLSTISSPPSTSETPDGKSTAESDENFFASSEPTTQPSEIAILTSLFGWAPVPTPSKSQSRSPTASLTRASSVAPTAPQTPSASRVLPPSASGEATPRAGPSTPAPRRPSGHHLASAVSAALQQTEKERDSRILHCALCQRRVGLWAFTSRGTNESPSRTQDTGAAVVSTPSTATPRAQPKRQFDLLKEHRSYCPYVVRSTTVPSLPTPTQPPLPQSPVTRNNSTASIFSFGSPTPARTSTTSSIFTFGSAAASTTTLNGTGGVNGNTLEGWRAVLAVVSRSGLSRRQQQRSERSLSLRRTFTADVQAADAQEIQEREGEPMELDGIEAMVEGVKSTGGKDLLKYVKGLLG